MNLAPHVIIGAGPTGCLLSVLLAKQNQRVDVFEVRSDPRKVSMPQGRSINMALSTRGIHALETAGLLDVVRLKWVPMRGRMIHDETGKTEFQPYGVPKTDVIYSISRQLLNTTLIEAARAQSGVHFKFQHKCQWMDFNNQTVSIQDLEEGYDFTISPNVVFSTDGAHSAIRKSMLRLDRFNYTQYYLDVGYKELQIPALADGAFAFEPEALHIWPRTNWMFIALPNLGGSFTGTLFLPFEGVDSFDKLKRETEIQDFFKRYLPDAYACMPNVAQEFKTNPTGSLLTLSCSPWNVGGKSLLLGDAAHAMTPFFGQGMNAAFEDCIQLDNLLKMHPSLEKAFSEFSTTRKMDADAISRMSHNNFLEMRNDVATKGYKERKKIEYELERLYPMQYQSLYHRVSFSQQPYHSILAAGIKNDRLISKIQNNDALIHALKDIDFQ